MLINKLKEPLMFYGLLFFLTATAILTILMLKDMRKKDKQNNQDVYKTGIASFLTLIKLNIFIFILGVLLRIALSDDTWSLAEMALYISLEFIYLSFLLHQIYNFYKKLRSRK